MGIRYLAIPYSHEDVKVKELRFEIANFVSAKLMQEGEIVFSPITHSHPLVKYGLPGDWEYWKKQDESFLNICDSISIVQIQGWTESKGIRDEVAWMRKRGIEPEYINPLVRWEENEEYVFFLTMARDKIINKYLAIERANHMTEEEYQDMLERDLENPTIEEKDAFYEECRRK